MRLTTPPFKCPTGHRRRRIVGALCACVVLPACAARPGTADTISTISTIVLERDCPGCPTGSRLELRRDGIALATVTGKARLGTTRQAWDGPAHRIGRGSSTTTQGGTAARETA